MKKTEVQIKREMSEKIAPEIKALIKKYGYEHVAYTWTKTVEKQRQLNKALSEAKTAQKKANTIKRQIEEL